jgi:hypothetical protein
MYRYSKNDRVNGGGLIDVHCLGKHSFCVARNRDTIAWNAVD